MLIEIKGKLSAVDLHKVMDILSSYFQKKGFEEFVEIDIDLKPISKSIKMPVSLSDAEGKEIRSIEITKSKSGELKLKEKALDNTWVKRSLDTLSPGNLIISIWPLYALGLGALILYLAWKNQWFF
ncbi:MAG: hypothetical protein K2X28_02755 [Alphaproteobacteria bacterium]|nr:hypothetical protein [Alphaproteobacteria bacterium]